MPPAGSSSSDRLRLWLERSGGGFFLRDAVSGDAVGWSDPRIRVVKVAGASYRQEALQDEAFDPGRRLSLVPEPDNEADPNAIAIWDADRRVQAGYVPADIAPQLDGGEQAVSLWEFREEGRRIGLRVLLVPAEAWVGEPRS